MSTQSEPKHYQCRHIHADGRQCGSRALRGEPFCYYHHTTRPPQAKKVSSFAEGGGPAFALERDTLSTFDLPLPDDRSSIQACIGLILQRIAHGQLDSKRAGLLLYGLQIASLNLPKPTTDPTPSIEEIVVDPTHGPIAPETELIPPAAEKGLYDFMMEQWELEKSKPLTIHATAEENLQLTTPNLKLTNQAFPQSAPTVHRRHRLSSDRLIDHSPANPSRRLVPRPNHSYHPRYHQSVISPDFSTVENSARVILLSARLSDSQSSQEGAKPPS